MNRIRLIPPLKLVAAILLASIPIGVFAQENAFETKRLVFYFEYNSSEPDSPATLNLEELKTWLSTVDIDSVRIEGNTDETGAEGYNYNLGRRRAMAVESFLKGYSPKVYSTIVVSNGEAKPVSAGNSASDHANNRRVDVILTYRMKYALPDIDVDEEDVFDSTTVGKIQVGKHGTRILLPVNLFYPNKLEDVKLYINEAMTPCDIVNQRLNTISVDNECLQTAGMVFLKAYVDGVEVQPAEGMQIEIQIPAKLIDPEMKLYESSNDRWALSEFKLKPTEINGEMFYVFKTKWKSGWNIDKVIGPCLDSGPVVKLMFGEIKYMQMYSASDTYLNAVPLKGRKHRFPTFKDAESSSIYIRVKKGADEFDFKGTLKDLKYSTRNHVYVLRKRDMHKLNHWEMLGRGSGFVDCYEPTTANATK